MPEVSPHFSPHAGRRLPQTRPIPRQFPLRSWVSASSQISSSRPAGHPFASQSARARCVISSCEGFLAALELGAAFFASIVTGLRVGLIADCVMAVLSDPRSEDQTDVLPCSDKNISRHREYQSYSGTICDYPATPLLKALPCHGLKNKRYFQTIRDWLVGNWGRSSRNAEFARQSGELRAETLASELAPVHPLQVGEALLDFSAARFTLRLHRLDDPQPALPVKF